MAEYKRLEGILVALATPLNEQERIDEPGMRRLLERLLDAGVHGIVVLGTAGEFAAIADAEKRRALEIAVDAVAGRAPIVAGTGEPGTRRAVATTQMAAEVGADAAIVVPPYYYMANDAAVLTHYRTVAAESPIPILLYNIPGLTKVTISPDVVFELAGEPNIRGLKDSSGNFAYFQRLAQKARSPKFGLVTGSDGLLFASLLVGGDGSIGPGANVAPAWFVSLWDAVKAGRQDEAWAIQQRITEFWGSIGYGAFPANIKAALSLMGICSDRVTAPIAPLTEAQKADVCAGLQKHGLL